MHRTGIQETLTSNPCPWHYFHVLLPIVHVLNNQYSVIQKQSMSGLCWNVTPNSTTRTKHPSWNIPTNLTLVVRKAPSSRWQLCQTMVKRPLVLIRRTLPSTKQLLRGEPEKATRRFSKQQKEDLLLCCLENTYNCQEFSWDNVKRSQKCHHVSTKVTNNCTSDRGSPKARDNASKMFRLTTRPAREFCSIWNRRKHHMRCVKTLSRYSDARQ